MIEIQNADSNGEAAIEEAPVEAEEALRNESRAMRRKREREEKVRRKRKEIVEELEREKERRDQETIQERLRKFEKWCQKYELEELTERRIPRLNRNRRIAILRGLSDQYKFKWIPLVERIRIGANPEINQKTIDGTVLKI